MTTILTKPLIMSFKAKDHTKVTLRPVVEEDANDIISSVSSIIKEGTYIQKERVRTLEEELAFIKHVTTNDHMYMAVDIEGKVKGIARVLRGELVMKQHTGLFRTWLHQDAQGKGIGKKVMEYTLEWCKQHNLHKLCLTVFATNQIAIKLYEKVGFAIEGIQKEQVCLNGVYDDEIFMAYFFTKDREDENKQ